MKGRKEGRKKGGKEERKEGRKQGKKEGRNGGRKEGRKEASDLVVDGDHGHDGLRRTHPTTQPIRLEPQPPLRP